MATVDLISLVFTQLLKIDPSILYKYTSVQDQLLYLLFIPHVLLFLFLYAFSFGIATRITGQSKGFTYLVGIASYIYIIYAGWYGKLVLLFLNWLVIALGMGLFLFFISIIIHPSATPAIMKLAGEAGKMSANRASKEKEKRAIEEEIDSLRREIASMNAAEQRATEPQAKAYIQMQRANLEAQKRRLESRV